MAQIAYWLTLQAVIGAGGGLATARYDVPSGQELTLFELRFTSTGAWGFYSIRNGSNRLYTNASQAIPLLSAHFQNGASPNIGYGPFPFALVVPGSDTVYFDLIDLSGAANTINLSFVGKLDMGGT